MPSDAFSPFQTIPVPPGRQTCPDCEGSRLGYELDGSDAPCRTCQALGHVAAPCCTTCGGTPVVAYDQDGAACDRCLRLFADEVTDPGVRGLSAVA